MQSGSWDPSGDVHPQATNLDDAPKRPAPYWIVSRYEDVRYIEMRVALEEWHARIPAYYVDPDDEIRRRRGAIAGVWHLPLLIS
ncbi:MAG TPA: hypothetical protein VKD67_04790 [Acidimicrobiales bacterium]|nr:hypothetical protein [Acidimicrobiales bacterium]